MTLPPGTDVAGLCFGAAGAANPPQTATGVPAGSIDLSDGKSSAFSISDGTTTNAVSLSATSLDKAGNVIGSAATQAGVAEAICRFSSTLLASKQPSRSGATSSR